MLMDSVCYIFMLPRELVFVCFILFLTKSKIVILLFYDPCIYLTIYQRVILIQNQIAFKKSINITYIGWEQHGVI